MPELPGRTFGGVAVCGRTDDGGVLFDVLGRGVDLSGAAGAGGGGGER
tara:strand:+ start:2395 stop:2538 length:144 start_codon:yes stop_codon:yes gene_type:complete